MNIRRKVNAIFLKTIMNILDDVDDQPTWNAIFQLALAKMNYGTGGTFVQTGELFALQYVSKKLEKEQSLVLFDVGANVGTYSKLLFDVFGRKAKIYSFEPSEKTYELFLETTKNIDTVIPNNFGFSDKEYCESLFTNVAGSGLASVYKRRLDHFEIVLDEVEEIRLSTVDTYCAENGISRIHFLKLDVEGHEVNVLNGAGKMIDNKRIDFIQFEFGGCNIDSRTYFQDFFYLLKNNYIIYRILKDGLHEIVSYKETDEIFITTNYLAVKK